MVWYVIYLLDSVQQPCGDNRFKFNLLDPENPVELAFQQHYGNIIAYKWFGDGYILIGFSSGYFIAISTHIKEVGHELFQVKNHKNTLTDIAVCEKVGKAASCGDNSVKIHDLGNLTETSSVLNLTQESGLERISWSEDGQLLAVCTRAGSLNVYVSYMQLLTSVCIPRIAVLSSLTEVSLYTYDSSKAKLVPIPITLDIEPSFIGLGTYHLAVGMNNRIWFYDLTKPQPGMDDAPLLLRDRQYLGGVTSIKINSEYAAVLYEGKLHLHMIEQPESNQEDRESIIFPDTHRKENITCYAITSEFLIIGTDSGDIIYFSIEEWSYASEYKHSISLTDLFVDISGTRVIFLDVKAQGYLYNAVSSKAIPIPDLPSKITGVTWDSNMADRNIFIIFNDSDIFTYVYVKNSIYDSSVKKIGQTTLVTKQIPLLMAAGEVLAATVGGQLTQLQLSTHDTKTANTEKNVNTWETQYNKQLALKRFQDAYNSCDLLKSKSFWKMLGEECMAHLEIELAIRIYKKLEDVGMVCSLKNIVEIEDMKFLCGSVSLILGDFDRAQAWFLGSSNPRAALEMRRDLLQWEKALDLAKKMAPEHIALLSREYAQQLEFIGSYSEALLHYEKGLQENLSEEHTYLCKAGIARCCLHCNNLRHGLSIAIELNVKSLQKECAEIMEKKKQLPEAALLYEKCDNYDRAAINYIKLKNWSKVGELLPSVSSGKIHLEYAKAKEREGQYQEAAKAYYFAKDMDSVIRLQLEYLNNPEEAVELVQETKSVEGAKLVAKFFQRLNDYNSAIRFLVMSKCNDEAFELARKHGKMELYGEILLSTFSADELKPQDFASIALHFENERNLLLSGTYWYHAREYNKALKHLITAARSNSKENDAITTAIDVVATSKSDLLCNNLIEYLLGETDGIPKDPKYLFRLYMAKKQYKEASKSAIIIANEEQINGNYRNAHDVLFGMYQELKNNNIRIPQDMFFNLLLLHSYILVRLHVKRGDHLKGARMLIRVANHISKFPSHIVPILTSTVIECHRAGLRHAAFKYASLLMNPEYRKNIDAKYAKKIEGVVRRPPKNGKNGEPLGDPLEALTPCPYCGGILPETDIFCTNCKLNIPFCIVTGRHIVRDDLTACPECDFPAIRVEFLDILDKEYNSCPMCSGKVDPKKLIKIEDTSLYLNLE
ncbi:hypothetical protein WA026_006430 [Henosepilachna vigintioctopunctata]|uniref:WD repeat-containing protein 19 n=1 Tax=Henosepilachna vigintioctopunctata TaxID=420089 RepID=A0AAW1TRF3_9CUCU